MRPTNILSGGEDTAYVGDSAHISEGMEAQGSSLRFKEAPPHSWPAKSRFPLQGDLPLPPLSCQNFCSTL